MVLWLETGDPWHAEKAEGLRVYLHELKTWIHAQEARDRDTTPPL